MMVGLAKGHSEHGQALEKMAAALPQLRLSPNFRS